MILLISFWLKVTLYLIAQIQRAQFLSSLEYAKKNGFVIASVDNKITWVKRIFENGNFKEAEKIIETGIAQMPAENGDFYPAFTFTISELENIFAKNNLEVVFQIGKPSFTSPKLLENKTNYDYLLNFELIHSTKKWFADMGGHIALIGKKI